MLAGLRPDVLVSFIIHVNVVAALAGRLLSIPTVVSERVHPAHHPFGRLREWARRATYPLASTVVVQTEDITFSDEDGGPKRIV